MTWEPDQLTESWARSVRPILGHPAKQYGTACDIPHAQRQTWANCLGGDSIPKEVLCDADPDQLVATPANIVQCFKQELWLLGLVLTIRWGAMGRSRRYIFKQEPPKVRRTLEICASTIKTTADLEKAWECLNPLGWSPVIRSKTLHFLCRAYGSTTMVPVPLDNQVTLQCLWPAFIREVKYRQRACGAQDKTPRSWAQGDFDAYRRYMTAILTWSTHLGWSTTETEATIFARHNGMKWE